MESTDTTPPTSISEETIAEPSNKFVDQISLEFLLNKTQYQKYLKKTDPQKFTEIQEFSENCSRLSRPIMDMTMRLLQTPKTDKYSQEVQDAFDRYARILIRYIEMKEMTDQLQSEYDNHDEDTLFPETMNKEGEETETEGETEAEGEEAEGEEAEGEEAEGEEAKHNNSFLLFHPPNTIFQPQNAVPTSQKEGAWWKRSSK